MTPVIVGVVALMVGVGAGFLIRASMSRSGARTIESQAHLALTNAQHDADQIRRQAEQVMVQAEQDSRTRRTSLPGTVSQRPKR